MQFNLQSTGKKRQMLFLPDINPSSLILFFENGSSGASWSLRDYSAPCQVITRYSRDFGWSADEVRTRAARAFDAPRMDVNNLEAWHEYTQEGNKQLLITGQRVAETNPLPPMASRSPGLETDFPILNMPELLRLPKASKRGDLDRILHSSNSEDYVTWNWNCLVNEQPTSAWWPRVLDLARRANPDLEFPFDATDLPHTELWGRVPSPRDYEAASRRRMLESSESAKVARARDSRPVEGMSEIDLLFEGRDYIIFVEAKLGSDISLFTTHDRGRDQISRNIHCLLERAEGRRAFFWMFTRDRSNDRAYVQLMREFQQRPDALRSLLPHRDPVALSRVCRNLSIVLWRDLLELACTDSQDDLSLKVRMELSRRCGRS